MTLPFTIQNPKKLQDAMAESDVVLEREKYSASEERNRLCNEYEEKLQNQRDELVKYTDLVKFVEHRYSVMLQMEEEDRDTEIQVGKLHEVTS
jgi:hypothetical protein